MVSNRSDMASSQSKQHMWLFYHQLIFFHFYLFRYFVRTIYTYFYYWCYGGRGEQIFVKCFLQKDSDWMPHTGLKCLNAALILFIMPLICQGEAGGGGGVIFYLFRIFWFFFLQLYFFNCLQSTVIKCLLNFIYWTPQLPAGGHQVSIKSLSYPPQSCHQPGFPAPRAIYIYLSLFYFLKLSLFWQIYIFWPWHCKQK